MNQTNGRITLLVIDDNDTFRQTIRDEGEDRGWTVMASDSQDEIVHWLQNYSPDVVLLDWQLPGQQRRDFAQMLRGRSLAARTMLLSGAAMDDKRRQLIAEFGLAGFRLKPLDLDRLDEEVALPPMAQDWPGLDEMADQVDVCIDILDNALNPIWNNAEGRDQPLTLEQRLIVKWLRAHLQDSRDRAARRLDWDGDKGCFLESRLFQMRNGHYWLERDWRESSDRPHDHELFNIERSSDLTAWLQAVAKLLAQRYAISRLRVYKIAPLPSDPRFEPEGHARGEVASALVMPLFQSGGGLGTTAQAWLGSGFLVRDNPTVVRALESRDELPPEPVYDTHPDLGCTQICFGSRGSSRAIFVVRGQDRQPVALFALDRRLDHYPKLTGFDKHVVEIATRMASDEAGVLSTEQWSLMRGLVHDIGERLSRRLLDNEDRREKEWHEAISTAMGDTFSEAGRSPEMTYDGLSQVCGRLVDAWAADGISGHVMGTSPWQPDPKPPLSTWYIALLGDDNQWQAVAGSGPAYQACRAAGRLSLAEPHASAAVANAWEALVLQDFQAWLKISTNDSYAHLGRVQRNGLGSWLGVPMQIDGKVRALMVAHSPYCNYFSQVRVRLMEHAAKRLLPLLAAAHRETRARSAFTAAVMHEVKHESHAALLRLETLEQLPMPDSATTVLTEIRHYLLGLNAMGQDALDIFQLGHGVRIQQDTPGETDQVVCLGELLVGMQLGWRTLYADRNFEVDLSPELASRRLVIRGNSSFRRVVRVLLHNAFRHGLDWVRISVDLQTDDTGNGRLALRIENGADAMATDRLRERLNPAMAQLGSSPFARGRLGLAVGRQLALEYGGTLGELEVSETDDPDMIAVEVSLFWPIVPLVDV